MSFICTSTVQRLVHKKFYSPPVNKKLTPPHSTTPPPPFSLVIYESSYIRSLVLIWYFRLIPESPRWLLLNNRQNEARNHLLKVAKMNKRTLPKHELERPVVSVNRASFRQLFSSWKMTKLTVINWDLW